MKKTQLSAVLFSILLCVLIGCTKKAVAVENSIDANGTVEKFSSLDDFKAIKAQIDFTSLNFNMASAQIFNMMVEPENYIGKTVKIFGKFYEGTSEYGDSYAVLYYDATACCQTGLSFIVNGDYSYPQDFPEHLGDIAVYGIVCQTQYDGVDFMYIDCKNFFVPGK